VVKNGKESACNAGDMSLIPESRRSPGEEMATHSSILAWEIPWTEEPSRLQSMGYQKSWTQLSSSTTTTIKKRKTQQVLVRMWRNWNPSTVSKNVK